MINLFVTAFLAISLLCSSSSALACSCIKMTEEQQFSFASDVFIGRVIESKWIEHSSTKADWWPDGRVEIKVQILERFKGSKSGVTTVLSDVYEGSNCTVPLMAGVQYVFFLWQSSPVTWCHGTRTFSFTIYDRQERLNEILKLKMKVEGK
jgi:hypothetical protein